MAALGLVCLLGARAMQAAERPGEGALSADGFLLRVSRADLPVAALSPEGVGALHVALYDTLTRTFDRYDGLVTAGRELFLVAAIISAVLLWRTARRLGLSDLAAAMTVLLAGVPALLPPVALFDSAAALAVPWLLLTGFLTGLLTRSGRSTTAARIGAGLAAVVAGLLAPVVVLFALSGAAAYLLVAGRPAAAGRRARTTAALVLAVAFLVVAVLFRGWAPATATAAVPDLPQATVVLSALAFLAIGGLAVWRLPAVRAPAIALVATTVVTFGSALLLDVLLVCLPVAAILTCRLGRDLLRSPVAGRRPSWSRPGGRSAVRGGAVAVLVCAGVAAVVSWPAAQARPSSGVPTALLRWAEDELPEGAALVAPRRLRAELLRAGAADDEVLPPGTGGQVDPSVPVLTVSDGEPPEGASVLARFDRRGAGAPVVVVDPAPGVPTAEELQRRRALAAAILANPRTSTGDQAAAVLEAAAVDQRLLSVLAALTARSGVGVAEFPTPAAQPDDVPLARQALLDSYGGEQLHPGAAATDRLVTWLDAQRGPFAPDSVDVTARGVLISFRYVSAPDALVTEAAP